MRWSPEPGVSQGVSRALTRAVAIVAVCAYVLVRWVV
jgi:hypothetical protein